MIRYDCWLDFIEIMREEEEIIKWKDIMKKFRPNKIWIIGRNDKLEMR